MLAMADQTGLVRATAPGIAKRAHLSMKATLKALETFEAPDPHSRSTNEEGRKIRRVDGGYQIINYDKYRKFDYTAAERMKRHRERVTRNGCNETVTLRKQKQKQKQNKYVGANGSRPTVSVEDWLKELEADTTYKGINVRQEYGKMLNWCKIRKKKPTQRRFINWINNADPKLPEHHASRADYKRNHAPPPREPTEAELENARSIARQATEELRQQLGK
jgi:hypothetical protein